MNWRVTHLEWGRMLLWNGLGSQWRQWRQGGDSNGALGRRDKGTSIMGTSHDGGGFRCASSSGVPKIGSNGRVVWAGGEGKVAEPSDT